METVYFNLSAALDALYTALRVVVNWLTTHGVTLHGVSISFFGLFCGALVASILLSFIVYDDDDANSGGDDE